MKEIDPWKTHKTNDRLVLYVCFLTDVIQHFSSICKHHRITVSQKFPDTIWVHILLPIHSLCDFWNAVPHLHPVVVTSHHFIRMSSQLADIITTNTLLKDVSDE